MELFLEIIFLHEHPAKPKWGFAKIAFYIHCCKTTVIYWVKKYRKNKDLSDKGRSGRPRCTTEKQDKRMTKMAKAEHNITSNQIKEKTNKHGAEVSVRTVRRRLHEAGGKYINEISKPLLTKNHREKRRRNIKTLTRIENLNANFMCKVYKKELLPSASKFFSGDNLDWFLQEDNDPKHRSKICAKWKAEKKIKVLPWSSMSPDQNLIENYETSCISLVDLTSTTTSSSSSSSSKQRSKYKAATEEALKTFNQLQIVKNQIDSHSNEVMARMKNLLQNKKNENDDRSLLFDEFGRTSNQDILRPSANDSSISQLSTSYNSRRRISSAKPVVGSLSKSGNWRHGRYASDSAGIGVAVTTNVRVDMNSDNGSNVNGITANEKH
ncbi:hypothetical protein Glove_794g2 [Diversispora epigaea]|uniref:Transposase Tc1-like domain-containing protein n=1 Tax=Diversispora epigaea TaxID=1348612 RepID=A0A397FYW3_9GLOM|nr:hypothetical protein Glove_794g2 [Diversispora epigaea]